MWGSKQHTFAVDFIALMLESRVIKPVTLRSSQWNHFSRKRKEKQVVQISERYSVTVHCDHSVIFQQQECEELLIAVLIIAWASFFQVQSGILCKVFDYSTCNVLLCYSTVV